MNQDKAIGMFIGLFVGEALGAPLNFINSWDKSKLLTEMEGGGIHKLAIGEWTDGGAMAVAIAEAYLESKRFDPEKIANNIREWSSSGRFGTRNYVFDTDNTVTSAVSRMQDSYPYAGRADYISSGAGSIMRLAPIVLANRKNLSNAIAQSIAVSLMTHGNSETVHYISGFVTELINGKKEESFDYLKHYRDPYSAGTIMHAYNMAWHSTDRTKSFEDALIKAVDSSTHAVSAGAVTGMLAGRKYGFKGIPERWLVKLMKCDDLISTAEKLYALSGEEEDSTFLED